MYVLYKIKIETDSDNIFSFSPDADSISKGAKGYSIKADSTMLKRILRRCGSADEICYPRSKRGLTYDQIISNILNGTNNSIYVFAHKYPKSYEDLIGLSQ